MLIDFNYTTEPLPGRFPLPGVGPFALLEESYMNHWGKMGFRWVYWNLLIKGEELPIDHRMVMAGKWS
jgi:sulfide:quinone oxidoreductase